MCVLFVAWRVRPDAPLVVASNRDEFHGRPTAPAAFWDDAPHVLAGRDLKAGGTWTGVTSSGRWAAVTNVRAPRWMNHAAPRSRGALVADFLRGDAPPADYAARITAERERFGGFNLLVGDGEALAYAATHLDAPRVLAPGFYGLSNATLDAPWPKVARGGRAFQRWIEADDLDEDALFALMRDEERAPDDLLPDTGVGVEHERMLSPLFIAGPDYGTRATTLLLVRADPGSHPGQVGRARFVERSFGPNGEETGTVAYDFEVPAS